MNRRNLFRTLTTTVTTLAIITAGSPAFAAADPNTAKLTAIMATIVAWITGILVGVATLFLTIGGLRYLAAGGDPAEVEKAKSSFKSALIGYALAILAPVLLGIVQSWLK